MQRFKPTRAPAGIFLLMLCLFSAGCLHQRSLAERDASFSPYSGVKVGQISLQDFLFARFAVVFVGGQISVTNSDHVFVQGKVSGVGSAAAIDRRGYFLTAAHCVKKGPITLAFLDNGQLVTRPARVVWHGDVAKKEPDLAVLQVSLPLRYVFDWTPTFTNGESAVAVGLSQSPERPLQLQCVAGKILRVAEGSRDVLPHYIYIRHDAPLHRGDSGGPLVSTNGRLIGIDYSVNVDFKWKRFWIGPVSDNAQRPDPDWLSQLIERDVAMRPMASVTQF